MKVNVLPSSEKNSHGRYFSKKKVSIFVGKRISMLLCCFFFLLGTNSLFAALKEELSPRESVRLRFLQKKEGDLYHKEASSFKKVIQPRMSYSTIDSSFMAVPVAPYSKTSFFGRLSSCFVKKPVLEKTSYYLPVTTFESERKIFATQKYETNFSFLATKKAQSGKTFPIKMLTFDSQAQGGLDHDQTLQKALKKRKNLSEVRALLDSEI